MMVTYRRYLTGKQANWSRRLRAALMALVAVALTLGGCQPEAAAPPQQNLPPRPNGAIPGAGSWPRTFPNAHGPDVELSKPAMRIVALQPNIAEMLCEIGGLSHIAAVDKYTDYPPEMARIPKVGDILTPDYERIVSLRPELVITSRGTPADVLQKLRDLGLQVLGVDPQGLDDVFSCMKMFGRIIGNEQVAADITAQLQRRRIAIAERARAAAGVHGRPKTVFVLSLDPIFVAGKSSFIADLIEEAGGEPAISVRAAAGEQPWPQISRETLLSAAPEVLIFPSGHGHETGAPNGEKLPTQLRKDAAWAQVPAVKQGRVYVVDDDLITIPGPRLVQALEQVAELLHPTSATQATPRQETKPDER